MKRNKFYKEKDKSKNKYLVMIVSIITILLLFSNGTSFAEESGESNDGEWRLPVKNNKNSQKMQPVLEGNSEEQSENGEQEDGEEDGDGKNSQVIVKSNIRYDSKGREMSWDEERRSSVTPDKIEYIHVSVEYDENNPDRVIRYHEEGDVVGLPCEGALEGLNNHYTLDRVYTGFNNKGQITGYTEVYDGEDEHRESRVTNTIYDKNGNKLSYHEEGSNKDGSYSFDRTNIHYNKLNQISEYNEKGIDVEGNQYDSYTYGIRYNSNGQRARYITDSTSSGSNTETSEDGSSTTTTTSMSSSHSVVTNMKYNALGQMISYEGNSTYSSEGHSTTTYAGYPGKNTVSDYTSSGSSQTNWKATYDEHGVQTECGTKSSQSHTSGTSVTTDEANPDQVITSEFERDYVDGQMTYSYETIHNSATPDLTTTVERTNIGYSQPSVYDWEEGEWDAGLMTSYNEVTHSFGSYIDEEGNVQQVDETTMTERTSTTYNELEQVTGYTETITTLDSPNKVTKVEMSDIVYDDLGRMLSYTNKTTVMEKGDESSAIITTSRRLSTEYNIWGQVIGYDEEIINSTDPSVITYRHTENIKYNSFGQIIQSLEIIRDNTSDLMHINLKLGAVYNSVGYLVDSVNINVERSGRSYQEVLEQGRNLYNAMISKELRDAISDYLGVVFNPYDPNQISELTKYAKAVVSIIDSEEVTFNEALERIIGKIGQL